MANDERKWIDGNRAAFRHVMQHAMGELISLGVPAKELEHVGLLAEHEAVRQALRFACAEYGDNDWPDNLSLVDVVNKHLLPHLDDARRKRRAP